MIGYLGIMNWKGCGRKLLWPNLKKHIMGIIFEITNTVSSYAKQLTHI
jgi:hypothetical protein